MAAATLRLVSDPRERRLPAPVVEVSYMDLDGDGIPDAVRITETRVLRRTADGRGHVVEITSDLVTGIDDDGVPTATEPTTRVEAHGCVDAGPDLICVPG